MDAFNDIKTLTDKGILVKLIYLDKDKTKRFKYLISGKWLNYLEIQEKVSEDIIDVSLNIPYNYDDVSTIIGFDFLDFPENVLMNDLLNPSESFKELGDDFLKLHESYIFNLKKNILNIKLEIEKHFETFLYGTENLNSESLKDIYILRFYPEKINDDVEFTYKKLKDDIVNKYFICNDQNTNYNNGGSTIPAFKFLGISDKNINNTDKVFIEALKRRWFQLIQYEKENIYEKLKNVDELELSEEEMLEYNEELKLYKEELNLIKNDLMNDLKTVKEIISYWPDIMQPKPFFVYED